LGMFSTEEEKLIRVRLADSLKWVVSQKLLPQTGGGRIAAFEVLCTSLRVKDSILHGESEGNSFSEIIKQGSARSMISFDEYILKLYETGLIEENTAHAYATRKDVVGRGVDTIKSSRGEATSDIESLELDRAYRRKL
ncbi:MAG: twitching motility protein, partial [Desulfobacteraceae bacterium]|nr:twitching motility protein [Desulfobacteraceae bacterium]